MSDAINLKQGDTFFCIEDFAVTFYKYFCVHPVVGPNYHIIFDAFNEPVKVYEQALLGMVKNGFETYDEAMKALAAKHEHCAASIMASISR